MAGKKTRVIYLGGKYKDKRLETPEISVSTGKHTKNKKRRKKK